MYYVYILISLRDSKYYYGSTKNLENRLELHNKGRVKSTKGRIPFQLHYFEQYTTRSKAYKRELFFKSIDGYNYLRESGIIK